MKRILSIVETPYRGTQEEQDDAAFWFTHSCRNAGSEMAILLRGNAVNYAVRGQDPAGLRIGTRAIERPPLPDADLAAMARAGISIHAVRDDVEERGIPPGRLAPQVELIAEAQIPALLERFDQIWHW